MSVPRVHSVVLVLAVALASCAAWFIPPGPVIPPRCREQSVTPVSCADTSILDNLLPHPDDCRLFYYCVSPRARPLCRQCPARLHFNPTLRVCDHPALAGCTARPPTTAAPDTTTAAAGSTEPPASTVTTAAPTVQTEATTTEGTTPLETTTLAA